jgi:Na+-transporting NADH:ubiquinone oxidoreductase subunit NqrB
MYFQVQQLLTLSLIMMLGKWYAYISLTWFEIVSVLFFTAFVSHVLLYWKIQKLDYFSFSALSTAIGVMLMLSSTHLWIIMFLIALGLASKHILQLHKKHFFNPSNFSLILGLLFFYHDAHLVLGQLGDAIWLQIVVFVLAVAILLRVKRWRIPMVFIVMYVALQYTIVLSNDPMMTLDNIWEHFYAVSFFLFIFFMLTDPQTTPQNTYAQVFFAFFIALCATLLDYYNGFRVQHLFLSLFLNTYLFVGGSLCLNENLKKHEKFLLGILLFLVLGAIIFIELQAPYYLEMNG